MGYFFRFWYQVIRTALYIIGNRKRETRRAYALLTDIEKRHGGLFAPATRRKIAISYGIYTPMICDAFTYLHGRRTNLAEKERFIHYFVCSSLFDDFTDITTLPAAELLALSFQPDAFVPRTFDEAVFRESHLLLRAFVRERTTYDGLTRQLFQAQWDSKEQHRAQGATATAGTNDATADRGDARAAAPLSDEALRAITFSKGGLSVLLCSFYLDIAPSPAERDCWYRIGTIIQLTNDLFDIYKDLQDHMDTLPTRMTDVRVFRAFFEEQVAAMQTGIGALPVTERHKAPFRLSIAGIYAFGFIALDQLAAIQGNAPTLPPLGGLPRKALIIDMEKRENLAKWLRYAYRYTSSSFVIIR